MRLGIAAALSHSSPTEWAEKHHALGLRAVVFPLDYRAKSSDIDAYAKAAGAYDLTIAEVGAWSNPMSSDPKARKQALEKSVEQLRLAERLGANCCVNISGTEGEVWDGGYASNYDPDFRKRMVETVRGILEAVDPRRTFYTLEPMPWMAPDSPEDCLKLKDEIAHPAFAVHMDLVNMISSPDKYFFNTAFMEHAFELLGPHIKSCHVKDVRLERVLTFNLKETTCGGGAVNLNRYAELAEKASPEMPFIIEHLGKEEEYLRAICYLQKKLAGGPGGKRGAQKHSGTGPNGASST